MSVSEESCSFSSSCVRSSHLFRQVLLLRRSCSTLCRVLEREPSPFINACFGRVAQLFSRPVVQARRFGMCSFSTALARRHIGHRSLEREAFAISEFVLRRIRVPPPTECVDCRCVAFLALIRKTLQTQSVGLGERCRFRRPSWGWRYPWEEATPLLRDRDGSCS